MPPEGRCGRRNRQQEPRPACKSREAIPGKRARLAKRAKNFRVSSNNTGGGAKNETRAGARRAAELEYRKLKDKIVAAIT